MAYLNFIAAGLALLGIALNLFQTFINIPLLGNMGLIDIINMVFSGIMPLTENFSMTLGIIFLVSIPVIALIGGIRSALKKGGYIFLAVSAIECVICALYLKFVISRVGHEFGSDLGFMAGMILSAFMPVLWGIIYFAACVCAYAASGKKFNYSVILARFRRTRRPVKPSESPKIVTPQKFSGINYEALSLKKMLTEGLAALSHGEFKKADEYFNHALIRKPDSPNALIGKLMVKYNARNANELVSAPVLLETKEFFQKALLSAGPDMKEVLNKYIRVNRLKRG